MLIAFISLVSMADKLLYSFNNHLSLRFLIGYLFSPIIYLLGIPKQDVGYISQLFGTKIALNEFIAYLDLSKLISKSLISQKSIAVGTFLLCGFANFGSIAIQVGGLAQMAPDRKNDFAALGFKAMICGALTSCISACIVSMIL